MTADCIKHSVLDTYCEIYFSFSFSAENGRSFSFSFIFRPKKKIYFSAEKENLFFGYFYFTAEKVKFIFGRPLVYSDSYNNGTGCASRCTSVSTAWLLDTWSTSADLPRDFQSS